MKRFTPMLMCAGLAALTAADLRAADEPSKEDIAKAEIRAAAVTDLALAADLAAFARDAKSPESLAVAGGMLVRANKTFGGKTDPLTDKDGKPLTVESVKSPGLDKQADALFDEARAMVATDKARAAALEALIGNARKFESGGAAGARPAVGGPKRITRVLNGGETHTFTVGFFSGQPAAVAMTSGGPAKIAFDITHVGGNSLFSSKGFNASYNWVPVRDKDNVRYFTITLTNQGRNPTTYTLVTT